MAQPASGHAYRPEIDGLRAVAVLAVILNHLDHGLLPGGWLGVDVFFVISGFVITASLAGRPAQRAGPWLAAFYARRVKRLAPALLVCVLVTALGVVLLIPPVFREHDHSLATGVGAIFGVSNLVLFADATNYFGDDIQLNPFAHTWSLGVEEQIYLLLPLLVWASGLPQARRRARRWLALLLGLLSLLSLQLFLRLCGSDQPAAYFLMPARFWEIGAGALAWLLLAALRDRSGLHLMALPPRLAWLLPLAQLAALLLLGLAMAAELPLPQAVPQAVIASVVLLLSARPGTPVVRLLSLPPLVGLGVISYSLYLWHWSVLALARWSLGVDAASAPWLLLLTLALALLSWWAVERPLRSAHWGGQPGTTLRRGLGLSALAATALLLAAGPGRGRLYQGRDAGGQAIDDRVQLAPDAAGITALRRRSAADREPRLILVGDSHARMLRPVLEALAGPRFTLLARDGCPFPPSGHGHHQPGCFDWALHTRSLLLRHLQPGDLIVISLYARSHFGGGFDSRDEQVDRGDGTVHAPEAKLHLYARSLDGFAAKVASRGGRLLLVAPFPRFEERPAHFKLCEPEWFRRTPADCRHLAVLDAAALERDNAALLSRFRELARRRPNLQVVDPLPALCPDGSCRLRDGSGALLYRDKDHLSRHGAERLRALFQPLISGADGSDNQSRSGGPPQGATGP
jgi:peptidoglycan/LPS O-acetylase OafA/YrhL